MIEPNIVVSCKLGIVLPVSAGAELAAAQGENRLRKRERPAAFRAQEAHTGVPDEAHSVIRRFCLFWHTSCTSLSHQTTLKYKYWA